MALESASFIHDLVAANPTGLDDRSEGDDHIRMVKAVLQATFAGLAGKVWRKQNKTGSYTAALTDNMTWLNFVATGSLNLPSAATAGNGYMLIVRAATGATVTIDPDGTETVDGSLTLAVSNLNTAILLCDGTSWAALLIQTAGNTELTNPRLVRPTVAAPREAAVPNGAAVGAVTLSCETTSMFDIQLIGNVTSLSFSNVPSSVAFAITLRLTQGPVGGHTIAWPGTVKWPSNVAPELSVGAAKTDIITLLTYDGGAIWYGMVAGQNY